MPLTPYKCLASQSTFMLNPTDWNYVTNEKQKWINLKHILPTRLNQQGSKQDPSINQIWKGPCKQFGLNDTIVWYHTTSGLRTATWKYKTLLCSYFAQLNDIVLRYASTLLANDEEYILFCIYNINFCVTDISLLMLCVLWNVKRLCFWFNRDIHNLALYT